MATEDVCRVTNANNCGYNDIVNTTESVVSEDLDIYCCKYVLNDDSIVSQQKLLQNVTLVRDLNVASLISDYVFVFLAIVILMFMYNKKFNVEARKLKNEKNIDIRKKKENDEEEQKRKEEIARIERDSINFAKKPVLYLTVLGSCIDIIITFSIVVIINQTGLVNELFNLYDYGCYSDDITLTILDLKAQFETILILDTVEGTIDILSLLILCCGRFKMELLGSMTEGIHGFMFAVFDLLLINVNVFMFVLPSHDTFTSSYNDLNSLCFEKISILSPTTPTIPPTLSPTISTTNISTSISMTTTLETTSAFSSTLSSLSSTLSSALSSTSSLDGSAVGLSTLYIMGLLYMSYAMAMLRRNWFIPSIRVKTEEMSPAIAYGIVMAIARSMPKLFITLFGTFAIGSNIGFDTIVGSVAFNALCAVGCAAIFTPGDLILTCWSFARDCIYYIISLIILALFYGVISPDVIAWWEALILLVLYIGYTMLMFNDQKLHQYVSTKILKEIIPAKQDNNDNENRTDNLEMTNFNEYSTNASTDGGHFHASLHNFLTKDSTVKDLMSAHIVCSIKGETKETFNTIDADGNGWIDPSELRAVLLNLGKHVTEMDITECFDEIDADGNGEISFWEFENWYLSSQTRITADAKRIFLQFDDNDDKYLDCDELRSLLEAINDDYKEITDEEVLRAMNEIGKESLYDKISEQEFIDWYTRIPRILKRQETLAAFEEEEENGIEIEFPETLIPRIMFIIKAPIMYILYYTLPDVQKEHKKRLWPLTLIGSIIGLIIFTYTMVWFVTTIASLYGISDNVMGFTLLAICISIPDAVYSVDIARWGFGDIAVTSLLSSNIFDILISLSLPWLLYCILIGNGQISVGSESLFLSLVILIIMVILVLLVIYIKKRILTNKLGWTMFILWMLFVAQDLIRRFCPGCNS